MKYYNVFIVFNVIYDIHVSNYNEDEGTIHSIVLNNSSEKYIIADSSKLNKHDFYQFYNLENVTALITDNTINDENLSRYSKYTKIIF